MQYGRGRMIRYMNRYIEMSFSPQNNNHTGLIFPERSINGIYFPMPKYITEFNLLRALRNGSA